MIIRGKNLMLFFKTSATSYKTLACATSCQLSIDVDLIEASGKLGGSWKRYRKGMKGWTLSADHLLSTDTTTGVSIMDLLNSNKPVAVCFATIDDHEDDISDINTQTMSAVMNRYGLAHLNKIQYTGQNGATASYSIELTGNGPLYDDTSFNMVDWQDEEIWTPSAEYAERTYKL